MTELHPETRRRYLFVMRGGQVWGELRQSYENAARRLPWMSVVDWTDEWPERANLHDDKMVVVYMSAPFTPPPPQNARRCKVAVWYSEAVGSYTGLSKLWMRDNWRRFEYVSKTVDVVIGETPTGKEELERAFRRPTVYGALGFDPEVYGTPIWGMDKTMDLWWYGAVFGRRIWTIPRLETALSGIRSSVRGEFTKFTDFENHAGGVWGFERQAKLNMARASLILSHSVVSSLATVRAWHLVGTSAGMLVEGNADCWPFVEGVHFKRVRNAEDPEFTAEVVDALLREDWEKYARAAHELALEYDVDRCVTDLSVKIAEALTEPHG
jgi:hypothetical protein